MNKKTNEKPSLLFFRKRPDNLVNHPPLASSLQHLETSFLLISLGRYPHALVSCASAIESALKAAYKTKSSNFIELLDRAQSEFTKNNEQVQYEMDDFRKTRNRIIHYGFSPKDDDVSAVLLLKTGYPLVEQCYETYFNFPLKQRGKEYGGLLPDLGEQLEVARNVYLKARSDPGLKLTYCFMAFAHKIRWGIQHWMMSDWQKEVLNSDEESGWRGPDFQHKQKEEIKWKIFSTPWEFNCPICGDYNTFVCELDDQKLDNGIIRMNRGICVSCGLVIPHGCPYLVDELCKDKLEEVRPKILSL